MKKTYIKPEIKARDIQIKSTILAGSTSTLEQGSQEETAPSTAESKNSWGQVSWE